MLLTPHQAKYIAHDLNPHQIEAAVFALRSPLSKGVLLDSHQPKDLPQKNRHQSKRHPKNTGQQPLVAMTALLFTNKSSEGSVQNQLPQINQAKQLRCFCPARFKRWGVCAPRTEESS